MRRGGVPDTMSEIKRDVPFLRELFFYESNAVYETSTGRLTNPAPLVLIIDSDFWDNNRRFLKWLVDEAITEAEYRNDWFNKIWLDGLKKRLAKSEKEFPLAGHEQSVLTYLFDKAYIESQTYKRYLKRQANTTTGGCWTWVTSRAKGERVQYDE